MREELERLDEPGARGAAAFDAEADHRPRAFREVFPRERMVGMVRQGRMDDPGHGVVAAEEVQHRGRVCDVPLHAKRQGLDRSEEPTSELPSLLRATFPVFFLNTNNYSYLQ